MGDPRRADSLRIVTRAFLVVTIALAGCAATPQGDIADARQRYLTAKAACVSAYPRSLTRQAECRAHAGNTYIRPYYRYGDLMTYVQARRRELAGKADRHEISRAAYEHQVAQAEAEVAREEDRRNRMAGKASSYDDTPVNNVAAGITRLFQ
jgi:outer membrane murein-binding lipoprotein Lpp